MLDAGMCICTYRYIYTSECMYICMCVYVCIYVYKYNSIFLYLPLFAHTLWAVCMHVFVRKCICPCLRAREQACLFI